MLGSGQFWGEMSLLTGEPRSVAVTELSLIAVGKDALMRIVQDDQRPHERIGGVVARRQATTAAAKAQLFRDAAALYERRSYLLACRTYSEFFLGRSLKEPLG